MRVFVALVLAGTSLALLSACGSSGGSGPAVGSATSTPTVTATHTVTDTPTRSESPTAQEPTSTAAGSAPRTQSAGPAPCSTGHLRLVEGRSAGAAGTGYTTYELLNTGAHACTLYGYPGVSVIDDSGHIVLHAAQRSAGLGNGPEHPTTVTVAAGARAEFVVSATDVIPDSSCSGRRTGSRLRVYPPNQKASLVIRDRQPFQACDLRVGPVYLHDR